MSETIGRVVPYFTSKVFYLVYAQFLLTKFIGEMHMIFSSTTQGEYK